MSREESDSASTRSEGTGSGTGAPSTRSQKRRSHDPKEVEDKYLQIRQENDALKRKNNMLEDRTKKLATQLLRITHDVNKRAAGDGTSDSHTSGSHARRDVAAENMIDDLQEELRKANKRNSNLEEKVALLKNTLISKTKAGRYANVAPRVLSATKNVVLKNVVLRRGGGYIEPVVGPTREPLSKVPEEPHELQSSGYEGKASPVPSPPPAPLAPAANAEDQAEERGTDRSPARTIDSILAAKTPIQAIYSPPAKLPEDGAKLALLLNSLRAKLLEADTELQRVRHENIILKSRRNLDAADELEFQALQKEVKEKGAQLTVLQNKYAHVESNFAIVKSELQAMGDTVLQLNKDLDEERKKSRQAAHQLTVARVDANIQEELKFTIHELNQRIAELEDQKTDLFQKSLDTPALTGISNKIKEVERVNKDLQESLNASEKDNIRLKQQVATLQKKLTELQEKTSAELAAMKEDNLKLRTAANKLQIEKEALERTIKPFKGIDLGKLERAMLMMYDERQEEPSPLPEKDEKQRLRDKVQALDELNQVLEARIKDLERREKTSQEFLETVQREHQKYAEAAEDEKRLIKKQMLDDQLRYKEDLADKGRQLDVRDGKIRRLENKLRDVTYQAARKDRLRSSTSSMEGKAKAPLEDEDLHQGENAVEISVEKVVLRKEMFDDEQPTTFVVWDFFEHETQATPVLAGLVPQFQFITRYVVVADEFFCNYIENEKLVMELYQARGLHPELKGRCTISLSPLISKTQGETLTAKFGDDKGNEIGTVSYTMQMVYPLNWTLKTIEEIHQMPSPFPLTKERSPRRTSDATPLQRTASTTRARAMPTALDRLDKDEDSLSRPTTPLPSQILRASQGPGKGHARYPSTGSAFSPREQLASPVGDGQSHGGSSRQVRMDGERGSPPDDEDIKEDLDAESFLDDDEYEVDGSFGHTAEMGSDSNAPLKKKIAARDISFKRSLEKFISSRDKSRHVIIAIGRLELQPHVYEDPDLKDFYVEFLFCDHDVLSTRSDPIRKSENMCFSYHRAFEVDRSLRSRLLHDKSPSQDSAGDIEFALYAKNAVGKPVKVGFNVVNLQELADNDDLYNEPRSLGSTGPFSRAGSLALTVIARRALHGS